MLAALALLAAAPAPLACGAVARPGIAERGEDGVWRGAAVDICRAIAAARNGAGAPIFFHSYDDLRALRAANKDRLAFVSSDELAQTAMRAGPVVAVDRQILLVPARSPLRTQDDLSGKVVCFIVGTRAEVAFNDWAGRAHVRISRLAFQEPAEMYDAYAVGKCAAMAIDGAELRQGDGSRSLGPALAQVPIFVATADADGAQWQRVVAAAVSAILHAPH